MKAFMDKDFMLQSATAQHLYHDYAADMPICDYHCHIPPREIYENRRFENIAQVWLGGRNPDGSYFGDHYKWRPKSTSPVISLTASASRSSQRLCPWPSATRCTTGPIWSCMCSSATRAC